MFSNKNQVIARFVKVLGVFAIVAALATMAFPTSSFASGTPSAARKPAPAIGKGTVTAINGLTGQPVAGAVIEFLNADNAVIAKGTTNDTGSLTLNLAEALYQVRVSAKGYGQEMDAIKVARNAHSFTEVTLIPAVDPAPTPTNH